MAAPVDCDRKAVNTRKRDAYTVSRAKKPIQPASGVEGSLFRDNPSPRLRLGTFNGRRPSRESLVGNEAGAPPFSRFLYRPHFSRITSDSQEAFENSVIFVFSR